jgi:myosin heavy subunit
MEGGGSGLLNGRRRASVATYDGRRGSVSSPGPAGHRVTRRASLNTATSFPNALPALPGGWRRPEVQSIAASSVRKGFCYYVPHPSRVWVILMVLDCSNIQRCRVRLLNDGAEMTLDLLECALVPVSSQQHHFTDMDNLSCLSQEHTNEPEILRALEARNKMDANRPYTLLGNTLLVVNPLQHEGHQQHLAEAVQEMEHFPRLDPLANCAHPYALAEARYLSMLTDPLCFSHWIIAKGASGGGTSRTCCSVLQYLAWRGTAGSIGGERNAILADDPDFVSSVMSDIDVVLTSFLGASTPSNPSSSRAMRSTLLQFAPGGSLEGARVEIMWEEYVRLTDVSEGHRNFNVFYEMLAGANKDLRKRITMLPLDYYNYLNRSSVTAVDEVDDKGAFLKLAEAMLRLGIDVASQRLLFKLLAGILHLGNVLFRLDDDDVLESSTSATSVNTLNSQQRSRSPSLGGLQGRRGSRADIGADLLNSSPAKVANKGAVELAASLLGIKAVDLERILSKGCQLPRGCPPNCGVKPGRGVDTSTR